jgi:hypothetical protein
MAFGFMISATALRLLQLAAELLFRSLANYWGIRSRRQLLGTAILPTIRFEWSQKRSEKRLPQHLKQTMSPHLSGFLRTPTATCENVTAELPCARRALMIQPLPAVSGHSFNNPERAVFLKRKGKEQ